LTTVARPPARDAVDKAAHHASETSASSSALLHLAHRGVDIGFTGPRPVSRSSSPPSFSDERLVVKIVHDELVATLGDDGQTIDLNAVPPSRS